MLNHTLIERDDSILIVIDAQPAFLDKLPVPERPPLLDRICWLMGVAGVVLVNVKNLYYEWMRTVEQVHRFRTECADLRVPDGLLL